MNCRKALKLIGPYMDGELPGTESAGLERHLESCPGCAHQLDIMHGLVRQLSSLPAIEPTAEEKYRLINRIRGEMMTPSTPKPAYRGVRVAAVGLSLIVAATIGVTWVIWGGGGPTNVEVTSQGGESAEDQAAQLGESNLGSGTPFTANLAASISKPSLVVSEKEYTPTELNSFRNDLGTRLDFYSSYWYPASISGTATAGLEQVQKDLLNGLAEQAQAAGKNPEALKNAVSTAMAQAEDGILLPCYAELAKVDGKEAWLISLSGPEDYLLFPDPQLPSAMHLASRGGEVSLKISESLLRELAGMLAPYSPSSTSIINASESNVSPETVTQKQDTTPGATATQGTTSTGGATTTTQQQDFQSFLRELAAQGNNLDLIRALEGLNYEQLLLLLQGNWGALAAEGVNLTDLLTPPQRLWAIDAATGTVIWHP